MNLRLTDYMICPRCAGEAGLVLLADRVVERRVLEGQLGCPACRTHFPVAGGIADFTAGDDAPGPGAPVEVDPSRLAALLGVTEGPATVALVGNWLHAAAPLAALLPDVEVVVAHSALAHHAPQAGVSVLRIEERLPLRARSMRAVAIAPSSLQLMPEAVRVCALAARVLVQGAAHEGVRGLDELGLRVLAEQDDTLLAVRQT